MAAACLSVVYIFTFSRPSRPLRGSIWWGAGLGVVMWIGPQVVVGVLEGRSGPGQDYTALIASAPGRYVTVIALAMAVGVALYCVAGGHFGSLRGSEFDAASRPTSSNSGEKWSIRKSQPKPRCPWRDSNPILGTALSLRLSGGARAGESWLHPTGADAQVAAALTSTTTSFSTAGVHLTIANETGHIGPSSSAAASLNPNVA